MAAAALELSERAVEGNEVRLQFDALQVIVNLVEQKPRVVQIQHLRTAVVDEVEMAHLMRHMVGGQRRDRVAAELCRRVEGYCVCIHVFPGVLFVKGFVVLPD